jgi:hypothetical protein
LEAYLLDAHLWVINISTRTYWLIFLNNILFNPINISIVLNVSSQFFIKAVFHYLDEFPRRSEW